MIYLVHHAFFCFESVVRRDLGLQGQIATAIIRLASACKGLYLRLRLAC